MGRKATDICGKKFGKLTVLERHISDDRKTLWLCKCECGNSVVVRGDHLKSGRVKSCGCIPRGKKKTNVMSSQEMDKTTDSLFRLEYDKYNPYQSLANAIIAIAADDYRAALQKSNRALEASLDTFFESEWFGLLTKLDANVLKQLILREMNEDLHIINISEVED